MLRCVKTMTNDLKPSREGKKPVLAREPARESEESLNFSFAADIVELVVFTTDDVFLQTLRAAVGDARRVWHVPSADKVSDLLIAGQVGILVLDLHALAEDAGPFVSQIKRQFPDLVVVAAGSRGDETPLANLISGGDVYRFIHKPMSPNRAKLFADAAVRKHGEQRRRIAAAPRAASGAASRRRYIVGAAGVSLTALIATLWALRHQEPVLEQSVPESAQAPAADLPTEAIAGPMPSPMRPGTSAQPAKVHEQIKPSVPDAAKRPVHESNDDAAEEADRSQSVALDLLSQVHTAIARRDFAHAATLIDAADGIASPTNVASLRQQLSDARAQSEADARGKPLQTGPLDRANEPQKREAAPIEPAAGADTPRAANAAPAANNTAPATINGPTPLTTVAGAVVPAANTEPGANGVPAASPAAAASIVPAAQLTLVKSVNPTYPSWAVQAAREGWVELDFTVAESGVVTDIAVHAANPPGLFDSAATAALAQWRYQPVLRDSRPVAQRARIRIRFTLGS